MRNLKPLTIFCCCEAQFVLDMVGNPEDRLCPDVAHFLWHCSLNHIIEKWHSLGLYFWSIFYGWEKLKQIVIDDTTLVMRKTVQSSGPGQSQTRLLRMLFRKFGYTELAWKRNFADIQADQHVCYSHRHMVGFILTQHKLVPILAAVHIEPCHEKTYFLHMQNQMLISAALPRRLI